MSERAKLAYDTFRGGFRDAPCPIPRWDDAEAWVRDAVTVSYLQGTLDGNSDVRRQAADEIEQLRAALQQIIDSDGRFDTMYDIAKNALSPTERSG